MMAQQTYTIKSGDTLGKLASQYGVGISDISGYRSGDPNKIFAGETVKINTRDIPAANTINAQNLNASPYQVAPSVPKTGYAGLIESSNAVIKDLTPKVDQGEKDIKGIYDKLGQQSQKRQGLLESEGVYEKEKAYKDITNTMNAKDLAYRRKIEKIQNENPDGQFQSGQQIAIDKVEREWASEKADLAISAAFLRDDAVLARSIVEDKISAETEDLTTELAGLQFFYSQNYNKLSDAQKTLLQQQTNQVQTELDERKSLLGDIGNIQLEAAANGAPADLIVKIGKATDVTQAISAAGKYIGLYDRMKADDAMGGGSSGVKFSDTQIANGAAAAGVTLSQFEGFDKDTQNFFINGDLSGAKKSIDTAFSDEGATLDEVKTTIGEMGLPAQGEQYLIQYAEQSAQDNAPLTPEQTTQTLVSSLKSLQTSGYSRGEAQDAVTNELTDGGKSELPKALKTSIEDALVEVYGRTFWQKVIPFGR